MSLGVVYCAVSKSYPGRCKIGKTFRRPETRIAELQKHYGSLHPFTQHDSFLAEHYSRVEWLAHRRLAHCREPVTEMFRCTPEEAMAAIRWAADEALRNPPQYQPRPVARPRTLAKGSGWKSKPNPWPLILLAASILAVAVLVVQRPVMPDWLPKPILRTVSRAEGYWP